jgi:uncharacterized metal-binding protein YceD (DUF177 family)
MDIPAAGFEKAKRMKKRDGTGAPVDPSVDASIGAAVDASIDPWRVPVVVAQIPETGLAIDIDANAAQRKAMADMAGLRDIASAQAQFEVTLQRGGRVHVAGRLQARIGQTCVVTLDPVDNDIDETIDLIFAPPEQVKELADLVDQADDDEAEVPEPLEPIADGVIDLGRLATDVLFLAIDPYPRKPGVVFEPRVAAQDPEDHPFAALKALRRPDTEKDDSRRAEEGPRRKPDRKPEGGKR